jgi:uncharacterized protein (DUF1330 family)
VAAFIVGQVEVTDPATYKEYEKVAWPTLETHAGKGLVADLDAVTLEGSWPRCRTIVIKFDDRESALAWFHSPEYQRAAEIRRRSANTTLALVDGLV